ncbi:MAG: Gfo/Idh/MocA family oxidoreductase [Anaerolineae bacterium]|nr:Gfo/Idh/MocA family oxidoreductase [Anaerolineae bacterium]
MTPKLKAVLVGCGGISRTWLAALKDINDVTLVGLVDLREETARERAAQYALQDAMITTDLQTALDKTHPDIVFDCTVPTAHHEVTLTALARGCHVLGEKPLADTPAHAREMVQAAQAARKLYAVIQNRRYDPNIRRLKHFLESGILGRITTVNCDFYIGAHFGGFRDHMEHVLLVDMAIHTFDMARLLSGTDARAVYCHEWNPAGSWYDRDASAIAIFEMTNDVVYTYRGSWCSEGLNTTWECTWRIIGEKGTVTWDGAQDFRAQVVAKTGSFFSEWQDIEVPLYDDPLKVGGHAGVIREFVRCVQTGETPETICSDNINSLDMVFGAVESAETQTRFVMSDS